MLVLAHTGITLGAALAVNSLFRTVPGRALNERALAGKSGTGKWLDSLAARFDIRALLIGALLPDIIDKPVGHFFFQNGRIFSHTLLFFLILGAAGIWRYRKSKDTAVCALSFGVLMHLVLDEMWHIPRALFWPVFGFDFDKIDLTGWAGGILYSLFNSPQTYVPEIIGGIILGWFGLVLLRRRQLQAFLERGRVS